MQVKEMKKKQASNQMMMYTIAQVRNACTLNMHIDSRKGEVYSHPCRGKANARLTCTHTPSEGKSKIERTS